MRKCEKCGARSKILETRESETTLVRRRECAQRGCRHRWTTIEVLKEDRWQSIDRLARTTAILIRDLNVIAKSINKMHSEALALADDPPTPYERAAPMRAEHERRRLEATERNRPMWTPPAQPSEEKEQP